MYIGLEVHMDCGEDRTLECVEGGVVVLTCTCLRWLIHVIMGSGEVPYFLGMSGHFSSLLVLLKPVFDASRFK